MILCLRHVIDTRINTPTTKLYEHFADSYRFSCFWIPDIFVIERLLRWIEKIFQRVYLIILDIFCHLSDILLLMFPRRRFRVSVTSFFDITTMGGSWIKSNFLTQYLILLYVKKMKFLNENLGFCRVFVLQSKFFDILISIFNLIFYRENKARRTRECCITSKTFKIA